MTHDEFVQALGRMLQVYIDNADSFDDNPQVRVNPSTLQTTIVNGRDMLAELDNNIENIEAAAGAQGMATQDDDDYQVKRNPDFYCVCRFITDEGGKCQPNLEAIVELADTYLPK